MKKKYLIILFLSLIASACNDNNQIRVIDLSQPQLLDNGRIILNWTAINIEADPEKLYYIMRSEDNKPFQTIKTISNYYNTPNQSFTFTDDTYSFECDSVRYQIIRSDKLISSKQLCVSIPKPIKLPDNAKRYDASIYKVIPEQNYLLILETGGVTKIHTYNYTNNKLISTINLLPIPRLLEQSMGIGKFMSKYELYFYDGIALKIFDPSTAQELKIFNIELNYPDALLSDNNGHIYCLSGQSLYKIARDSFTVNKYDLNNRYLNMHYINNRILCIGDKTIDFYTLIDGIPKIEKSKDISGIIISNSIVSDGKLIFTDLNGKIYILDINTWEIHTLRDKYGNEDSKGYYKICASHGMIYASWLYYSGFYGNQIYCFSLSDYIERESIITSLKIPINSIASEDYLFYSGHNSEDYFIFKRSIE